MCCDETFHSCIHRVQLENVHFDIIADIAYSRFTFSAFFAIKVWVNIYTKVKNTIMK